MEAIFSKLQSCDLSKTSIRRALPPNFFEAKEPIEERYDWTTLWYEALWTGRYVAVVCPRLFHLEEMLVGGQIRLDGHAAQPTRIERRVSHTILWFRAKKKPAEIAVDIDGQTLATPVTDRSNEAFFKGLNTVFMLQQNNGLDWIRDFLTYHRVKHRLEAVLCFDNASSDYTPEDLARTMAEAGMSRAMIFTVPHRYGARGCGADGVPSWEGTTLQFSLINIARLRLLRAARAVLQCDIDELVWCRNDQSIFDMARRHALGITRFGLEWRYARVATEVRPRHSDHIWRRSGSDICPAKYCIAPRGPMSWASWEVHDLDVRGLWRLPLSKSAGAWHCRQVSTNWNDPTRHEPPEDATVRDDALADVLAGVDFNDIRQDAPVTVLRDDRAS